jgi:hypothetical protein
VLAQVRRDNADKTGKQWPKEDVRIINVSYPNTLIGGKIQGWNRSKL